MNKISLMNDIKINMGKSYLPDKIITVIRYLADHDERFLLEDGIVGLKGNGAE